MRSLRGRAALPGPRDAGPCRSASAGGRRGARCAWEPCRPSRATGRSRGARRRRTPPRPSARRRRPRPHRRRHAAFRHPDRAGPARGSDRVAKRDRRGLGHPVPLDEKAAARLLPSRHGRDREAHRSRDGEADAGEIDVLARGRPREGVVDRGHTGQEGRRRRRTPRHAAGSWGGRAPPDPPRAPRACAAHSLHARPAHPVRRSGSPRRRIPAPPSSRSATPPRREGRPASR